MSTRSIGLILVVAGIVILAIVLGADLLGIGSSTGFGWKQQLGTAVGVIAIIAGGWFLLWKKAKKVE